MSWKPKETMWHLPWKYQVPQRVPFFLWLAFKQQLLTNTKRVHRGLRHNSVCGQISEDVIHAIRDCPATRSTWNQLIPVEEHDRIVCSVFDAELWGILDGLTCLVDRGYDNIIIQSNNLDVVKNIQEGLVEDSNTTLVRIIHQMLLRLGH
ncbi:hypothetical protein Gorai_002770 [Gossypium raimondii]|uniref:Reverse transcriptase zinc-binding domain-containing protein n=1 Tax=Gossypium raimondii TaxID=29730 RepID=A0A7J8QLZ0_GOSRA|nr:hypothetical protein [Gossypium raimondii]